MGVVHKLKPEIIEFIVQKKQEDPRISCRKVVDIVAQTFQVKLSKSSINDIWKNASLSSPVGRRTGLPKTVTKVFKIPSEKRHQLFAPGQSTEAAPETRTSPSNSAPHPARGISSSEKKKEKLLARSELCESAGSFFLKIAEWDLTERSILAEILIKKLKGYEPLKLQQWADILLAMPLFGLKNLSQLALYSGKGLWAIQGGPKDCDPIVLKQLILSLGNLIDVQLSLSIELTQANQWVSLSRMSNEKNESVWIDSSAKGLHYNNVQSQHINSLQKVIKVNTAYFLDNVQSVVLENITFDESFDIFWAAMEGSSGRKMKNMTFYDPNGTELIQLDLPAAKKRYFVSMIWPWQKEFQLLAAGNISQEGSIYLEELGKEYSYQEVALSLENQVKIRGFMLKEILSSAPLGVVITNASVQEKDAREIVAAYLLRWPNLGSTNSDSSTRNMKIKEELERIYNENSTLLNNPNLSAEENFFQLLDTLQKVFLRYVQTHYFPENIQALSLEQFRDTFVALPGYIQQTKNLRSLSLVPPADFAYIKELAYAAKRMNESCVLDWQGRRVLVQVLFN